MYSFSQLVRKVPILKSIASNDLRMLSDVVTLKTFKLKEQIYSPADAHKKVYLLFRGQVKLYELSFSGKKVIVDVLDAGAIFGDISTNGHDSPSIKNFAESIDASIVGVLPKERFHAFLLKYPTVSLKVIDLLSQKLLQAEEKIKDLSLGKIENRILHELIRFSKKSGRETRRVYVVTQKITHEELAGMVGTTRETVTKTLNDLKRKRVVAIDLDRQYRIDKQKLVYYTVY